ncbi:DNA-binding transcriptional regulator, LysR family [Enhydrobacter aerosaccus]|uniref:DNA-binding transcriptional regulator, LysR family n=1 Tax=Enhydrobacter aerosaccus TaxID=225324 RepID=A0A1T4LU14_9HYPH|nr:LysR substrate-binding domain-containing protein [Enhydrobacter aerosaccus]SJZ58220.1 DNA-binding transcriptional regulator, LysR family [Enhydrobacter aerosaccus]
MRLDDLSYFVKAVEAGGFAASARQMNCPKSTISKRVAELEKQLGVRLIERSSRHFVLTDLGREVFEHARAAVIEADAVRASVEARRAEPAGRVRITASKPTAEIYLAERLPQLSRLYPRLLLEVDIGDRFVDLAQEKVDIAIRSHFDPLPDSTLVARTLGRGPVILVASPGYAEARGTPNAPGDLAGHDGLWSGLEQRHWRLSNDAGQAVEVSPRRRFVANESHCLISAAAQGLGIAPMPHSLVRRELDERRLVRILPEWTAGTLTTTMLMTHRRNQLPAIRAVAEFLSAIDRA